MPQAPAPGEPPPQAASAAGDAPGSGPASEGAPAAPARSGGPPEDWAHRKLYEAIKRALHVLPDEFESSLDIKDFRATDIFTLNTALGASIEDAAVNGLNRLRALWDPDDAYIDYRFERQAQTFPDVRLVRRDGRPEQPLLGLELKGWFAMAKEAMPTFRYKVTPGACAEQDLLVVFPWVLTDVIAGRPRLLRPYIDEARFCALMRNHYWLHMRGEGSTGTITPAPHNTPYPSAKTDQCSDVPSNDKSHNFGRLARSGIQEFDEFIEATLQQHVSGIPVTAWVRFFVVFSDNAAADEATLQTVQSALKRFAVSDENERAALLQALNALVEGIEKAPLVPAKKSRAKPAPLSSSED